MRHSHSAGSAADQASAPDPGRHPQRRLTRASAWIAAAAIVAIGAGVLSARQSAPASAGASPPVRFSNPSTVAPPIGAYSHVAVVAPGTELLYVAGQVGLKLDGSLPDSPEEQFTQALTNVVAILKAEGATPADIIKLNTYLVRPMQPEQVRAARQQVLGANIAPASTLVYVPRLAQERFLVEIEAVAVRKGTR
jgi:2-iminobutanoate/2-iminopropanoate deaminase